MDPIVLHQPARRPWGMPNLSPFCCKLETYLRMAEVPYEPRAADIRKAPKGKVPFVELGGARMGDSQLIIEQLEAQLGARALDAGMSPRDRAVARVIRRTFEEAFYFVMVYTRWVRDDGWAVFGPEIKHEVPGFARPLVPIIRRVVKKMLRGQGTGRHTPDEVAAMGTADLDAAAELLGDQDFLFGARPRVADATLYAFVEGVLGFPLDTPLQRAAKAHPNLVAYRERVRARWWKELASLTDSADRRSAG